MQARGGFLDRTLDSHGELFIDVRGCAGADLLAIKEHDWRD
jgi:hypothetical protein